MPPALRFAPELLLRAQGGGLGMKAAIFDVDGVLTDGRLYIGEQGETVKAFSTLDGHGLKLLQQGGIAPLVITGRDSPAVRRRVADLGLVHAVYGVHDKLAAAQVIDPAALDAGGKVVFGSTVDLEDAKSGAKVTYQIVGDDEADLKLGLISISSPIARALIGKEAGDVAEVQAPGGLKHWEIVDVRYA